MMQTFSWPGYKTQYAAVLGCFASDMMRVEISPLFTGTAAAISAPTLFAEVQTPKQKAQDYWCCTL